MANILYRIVGHGLDGDTPPLSLIVLNLVYLDTEHNYCANYWCALTAEHPQDTWQFDPGPATAGVVLYDGQQFGPTGEVTPIPLTVADGTTIEVGAGVPATIAVTVTPLLIDWTRVARVDAELAGHPLTFTAASATARWLSLPAAGYPWTVTYTLNDDSTWEQSGAGSPPLLVLPALPPVTPVTFSPVADYFETLPIESIALSVTNPGGSPGHSIFNPGHTQPWSTGIFQTAISPVAWRLDYRYRYVVTFKPEAGLQPFDSGEIDGLGATSVTLDEVGIREFVLDGQMPSLIKSVSVHYEFGGKSEKRTLPVRLVARSNYTPGSFSYWLQYDRRQDAGLDRPGDRQRYPARCAARPRVRQGRVPVTGEIGQLDCAQVRRGGSGAACAQHERIGQLGHPVMAMGDPEHRSGECHTQSYPSVHYVQVPGGRSGLRRDQLHRHAAGRRGADAIQRPDGRHKRGNYVAYAARVGHARSVAD